MKEGEATLMGMEGVMVDVDGRSDAIKEKVWEVLKSEGRREGRYISSIPETKKMWMWEDSDFGRNFHPVDNQFGPNGEYFLITAEDLLDQLEIEPCSQSEHQRKEEDDVWWIL